MWRRLVPYLGLTLAVAAGIALAPYVWWILTGAACLAPFVLFFRRLAASGKPWWKGAAFLLGCAAFTAPFAWWAIWLARQGNWADVAFVCGLYVFLIVRGIRDARKRRSGFTETATPPAG